LNPAWWTVLAIAPTDDVRSVKRAYAIRLKLCRPEDDPKGFAQLREAYDGVLLALARMATRPASQATESPPPPNGAKPPLPMPLADTEPARPRGGAADRGTLAPVARPLSPVARPLPKPLAGVVPIRLRDGSTDRGTSAPMATPLPPVAHRISDDTRSAPRSVHEVVRDILEEARRRKDQPSPFTLWLQHHEDLLSLDFKAAISQVLLRRIADEGAVARDIVDILSDFFSWTDYRNRASGSDVLLAKVRQRLAADDFRQWLDSNRYNLSHDHRVLNRVRKFGAGKRAWLLATYFKNRRDVAQSFRKVCPLYGEPAVVDVLGKDTFTFWRRALAPVPTLVQLSVALPVCLLMATLSLTLRLTNLSGIPPVVLAMLFAATAATAVLSFVEVVALIHAFWKGRATPYIRLRMYKLRQTLHLQGVPTEVWGIATLSLLAAIAQWWPANFAQWPFYAAILIISFSVIKNGVMLFGCVLATATAVMFVMQTLVVSNLRLPFLLAPATLWGARQLHHRAQEFFPKMRLTDRDFVALIGSALGLLFIVLTAYYPR
jgi:hypothetical protein